MAKSTLTAEPGKHEIRMTRLFDAPRELVFKTCIDPKLIPQWWGSGTIVDKMEAKAGGEWRYVQHHANGNEYAFHGVYHDITAPQRVVNTFEFEGMPGHVLLETVTFEDQDGKTLITTSSVFQSVEDRDGMIQSGMERGANESWDRLAALLREMQH